MTYFHINQLYWLAAAKVFCAALLCVLRIALYNVVAYAGVDTLVTAEDHIHLPIQQRAICVNRVTECHGIIFGRFWCGYFKLK
jgi:hypothetical protein